MVFLASTNTLHRCGRAPPYWVYEYAPITESNSIDTLIVREPTPLGELSASGSYSKRHVDIYVFLPTSAV